MLTFKNPSLVIVVVLALLLPSQPGGAAVAHHAPGECFPAPFGLTNWWPGDGNTDDIIGGQHAVLHGNATTDAGLVDEAFILDGDGDFVAVPHDPALNFGTGDFTVDFWVFFNDTEGEQVLIEKWIQRFSDSATEGWTLTKLETNEVGLFMSSADGSGGGLASPPLSIPTGSWVHFAATRQAGVLRLFMNGVQIAEEFSLVNISSNSSLKFGHRGNPTDTPGSEDERGFFLNGRIDEVDVAVGRALSAEEISRIFQAGTAGKCKRIVGPRACFPLAFKPTNWWPGDGNLADIVGGRTAVLHGDALMGFGLVSQAFILDGDGDFVEVPHHPALNFGSGDFTVDLWVLFNDTAGEQILVEKWIQRFSDAGTVGWTFTKLEDNKLVLALSSSDGSGWGVDSPPLAIPSGNWVHFAATRGAGKITLYMNGVQVAETFSLLNVNSNSSLKFGHRGNPTDTPGSEDDSGFYLNGRIDEVGIFVGRALPPGQVRAIFEAGSAGKCK
jgi:hypothetical protein